MAAIVSASGEFEDGRVEGGGEGPDGPDTPAVASVESGGASLPSSITWQAGLSGPTDWRLLLVGTDTLELGFYVEWNEHWPRMLERLGELKLRAVNTKGIELPAYMGHGLMLPSGRPPAYTFHLQLRGIQVWIAKGQHATQSPNVFVRLPSDRLWHENIGPQIAELRAWITGKGGTLERVTVSRWDIAADFLLPEGLTSNFLRAHVVAKARKRREDSKGDQLETFYVGQGGGPISLRIYDKIAELAANHGEKNWFFDLWKATPGDRVWRVEYQLRRKALKEFGAKELDDLPMLAPMIWNALTESVVSFRIPGNQNVSRREVHPWWAAVQGVGEMLGSTLAAERNAKKPGTASADWYIAHAAGCLIAYAARMGVSDLGRAADALLADLLAYWALRDFLTAYRVKRHQLNLPVEEAGEEDGQGVPE